MKSQPIGKCKHKFTGRYLQDCDLIMHCEKCGEIQLINTHLPSPLVSDKLNIKKKNG